MTERHPAPSQSPEKLEADGGTIDDPQKLLRLGLSIRATLDEIRDVDLDDEALDRLRALHRRTVDELAELLSPDLREELEGDVDFPGSDEMTQDEIRVAQARLTGWLDGLFRGVQATAANRQIARQLEEIKRDQESSPGRGQYL